MARPGPESGSSDGSFARLIGTSISIKMLVDTGVQIFNPFLEIIAVGLGTGLVTMGALVGLRSSMGLFSPLLGSYADRNGFRTVMRLTLLLGAAGMLLIGLSSNVWTAAIGFVLCGLGFHSFVPILHAYLSARLPYSIRGRGMGMVEYSWALTGIIGLFLVGLLIEATGWRTPFIVLAVLLALAAVVIGRLPAARPAAHDTAPAAARQISPAGIRDFFHLGRGARSAYATIIAGALNFFAGMQIMIIHGAWLGQEYGLGAAQLGTVALVLGLFDLAGSVSVSLFTDRIGKRRSVMLGLVGAVIGYCLMPFFNLTVLSAILIIAVTRGMFEFSIVSNFPLLSEQAPEQRGKMLAMGSAAAMLGGTAASFIAPLMYTRYGVPGFAWVSAAAALLAIAILYFLVSDQPAGTVDATAG